MTLRDTSSGHLGAPLGPLGLSRPLWAIWASLGHLGPLGLSGPLWASRPHLGPLGL